MALSLLSVVFTILLACLLITILSFLYIFLSGIHRINDTLRHPYLDSLPWARLSFSNKTGVLLDYFLRLFFPNSNFALAKNANTLLAHVNPQQTPLSIKLPILGLWGGCALGMVTMIVLWILILFVIKDFS